MFKNQPVLVNNISFHASCHFITSCFHVPCPSIHDSTIISKFTKSEADHHRQKTKCIANQWFSSYIRRWILCVLVFIHKAESCIALRHGPSLHPFTELSVRNCWWCWRSLYSKWNWNERPSLSCPYNVHAMFIPKHINENATAHGTPSSRNANGIEASG